MAYAGATYLVTQGNPLGKKPTSLRRLIRVLPVVVPVIPFFGLTHIPLLNNVFGGFSASCLLLLSNVI